MQNAQPVEAIQMTDEESKPTRRYGLRKGQIHSGSFKPGNDARRVGYYYDGKSFSQIAREHAPKAIALWVQCLGDDSVPWPTRIRASELIVERAHGKAVSVIDMNVTANRSIVALTTDELEAIVAGELLSLPIANIEGEHIGSTVPNTVDTAAMDAT